MRGLIATSFLAVAACEPSDSADTGAERGDSAQCDGYLSADDFWPAYAEAFCHLAVDQCRIFTTEQCAALVASNEGGCLDPCRTRDVLGTVDELASDTAEDCQDLPAEASVPYCDSGE